MTPDEKQRFQAMVDDLGKTSAICMEVTGVGVLSLPDLEAWVIQGGPEKPVEHQWVPVPGDKLQCALCGVEEYVEDTCLRWCPKAKRAE